MAFLVIAGMRLFHAAEKETRYAAVLIVETFENSFMCVARNNQEGLNQSFITTAMTIYAIVQLHPSINVPIWHIMGVLVN